MAFLLIRNPSELCSWRPLPSPHVGFVQQLSQQLPAQLPLSDMVSENWGDIFCSPKERCFNLSSKQEHAWTGFIEKKRNLPWMAWCCQSEPECQEGWFSLVWLDIKMGMTHMTLTMHLLFLCVFINSCIKKSEGPMNSLPERLLESGKSLFPAHEQPEGHQNVVLKSYRKLRTHFVFH